MKLPVWIGKNPRTKSHPNQRWTKRQVSITDVDARPPSESHCRASCSMLTPLTWQVDLAVSMAMGGTTKWMICRFFWSQSKTDDWGYPHGLETSMYHGFGFTMVDKNNGMNNWMSNGIIGESSFIKTNGGFTMGFVWIWLVPPKQKPKKTIQNGVELMRCQRPEASPSKSGSAKLPMRQSQTEWHA